MKDISTDVSSPWLALAKDLESDSYDMTPADRVAEANNFILRCCENIYRCVSCMFPCSMSACKYVRYNISLCNPESCCCDDRARHSLDGAERRTCANGKP